MDFERINPVALITGAASGVGAACAQAMARRAEGGLILVDANEAGLEAAADALDDPPERVSTLAFEGSDEAHWARASAFIQTQYGRLDWAIVNIAPSAEGELVDWGRAPANFQCAAISAHSLMQLMRSNTHGGAIVLTAQTPNAAVGANLLQLARAAAQEGAASDIRVNAVAIGAAPWPNAPSFEDLARGHGGERPALEALARLTPRLARFAGGADISRPIALLLSDAAGLTGAALAVDGGYAI